MTTLSIVPRREFSVAFQFGIFYLIKGEEFRPLTPEQAVEVWESGIADWSMTANNRMIIYLRESQSSDEDAEKEKINLDNVTFCGLNI